MTTKTSKKKALKGQIYELRQGLAGAAAHESARNFRLAIFLTLNMGARPPGELLAGVVDEAWGALDCSWRAGGGFGVQALLILRSPLRGLGRLPEAEDA